LRWWDGYQWSPHLQGFRPVVVPERPPKGPGIKGGGIAAIGAGVGLAGSIAVAIAFFVANHGYLYADDPWYQLSSELALWCGFLGAVVVASIRNGTRNLSADFGLAWPKLQDLYRGLLGGMVARVPAFLLVLVVVLAGNQLDTPNNTGRQIDGMTPDGRAGWVIAILLVVVGAPIVEELFFRGLIQGAFTRRIGAVRAIFVTALIFSFAHVLNEGPLAPFVLFPAALVLGYLRYRTGRLAAGMIAHSMFNALALVVLLIPGFR
jgi:uncharacterized protein